MCVCVCVCVCVCRDAYKVLLKYQCSEDADLSEPAAKRARNASRAGYVVCLSPSASCVAIARGDTISMYNTGGLILGVKGQRYNC